MKKLKSILAGAALVLLMLGSAGCASTEPDTLSERPWNAPKSWEHGLPTGMMPRY